MAKNTVEFKFDFDTKDVEIAAGRTLSLKEEMKLLQKELLKTKEGTAEFEILKNKMNETQDNITRVNAKSRELFGTFQLIPGPIGEISSKIDGSISLLKTFSGFSLKDIKSQFLALGADLVDIGKNFAKATGLSKVFSITTTLVSKALKLVGIEATTASFGVKAFSAALIGTGIGAVVVLLGSLVSAFMSAGNETDKYKEKVDALNDSLARQRSALKRRGNEELAEAKARGASESELAAIRKKNTEQYIGELKRQAKQDEITYFNRATLRGADSDEAKEALKKYQESQENVRQAESDARIEEFQEQERLRKENEQKDKDAQGRKKQRAQESLEERGRQLDAEIELEKNKANTDETVLKDLLLKKKMLALEGKKVSEAEKKAMKQNAEKEAKDEVDSDKEKEKQKTENKQKENQKIVDDVRMRNEEIVNQETQTLEKQKLLYGETSQFVIDQNQKVLQAKTVATDQEIQKLEELSKTQEGLNEDQKKRLNELKGIRDKNFVEQLDQDVKTIQSGLQKNLQLNDNEVKRLYKEFENGQKSFQQRKKILEQIRQEEKIDYDFKIKALEDEYNAKVKAGGDEVELKRLLNEQKKAIDQEYSNTVTELNQKDTQIVTEGNKATFDSFIQLGNAIASAGQAYEQGSEEALFFEKVQGLVNIAQQAGVIVTNLQALGLLNKAKAENVNTLATMGTAAAEGTKSGAKLPFPANIVAIASIIGAIIGIWATIKKTFGGKGNVNTGGTQDTKQPEPSAPGVPRPRGMASGGFVSGPGGGKSDFVPAMLSSGESVINSQSTSMFLPLLSTINQMGGGKRFEGDMSSLTTNLTGTVDSNPQPIRTYVVSRDMTSQQMLDRQIKERSTL